MLVKLIWFQIMSNYKFVYFYFINKLEMIAFKLSFRFLRVVLSLRFSPSSISLSIFMLVRFSFVSLIFVNQLFHLLPHRRFSLSLFFSLAPKYTNSKQVQRASSLKEIK